MLPPLGAFPLNQPTEGTQIPLHRHDFRVEPDRLVGPLIRGRILQEFVKGRLMGLSLRAVIAGVGVRHLCCSNRLSMRRIVDGQAVPDRANELFDGSKDGDGHIHTSIGHLK